MFDKALTFAKAMNELYIRKEQAIHKKRVAAQNNPLTKARKSRAMKKWWAKKKAQEIEEREKEKRQAEYIHESCYCHTGNPPCSYCTDTNYCEKCDANTWDDECPKCGKAFDE